MPFSRLDTAAIARSLAQVADREDDLSEVFLERLEEIEVPADGEPPGVRVRSEAGFSVRLVREGLTWFASRDGFSPEEYRGALREVARALPAAAYPDPVLEVGELEGALDARAALGFPAAVDRAIRGRHVAFPMRLKVRGHRRAVQVVGARLVPEPQQECYFSCAAELPWGTYGALFTELGEGAAEELAGRLIALFAAREARSPASARRKVMLAPGAAAVLLHEAVAHALEADTLILGGRPEAAAGLELGSSLVNVVDDPATAPVGVRRSTDDEGMPVVRRWLVKEGVVDQPLADQFAARNSGVLVPGAARRATRFDVPTPRSHHLELAPGADDELALRRDAAGGLYVTEVSNGRLDPFTGAFSLRVPYAHELTGDEAGQLVGPFTLRGHVSELLGAVVAVSDSPRSAGAGWCAKGGQRLAVWALAPSLLLDGIEVCG